MATHRVRLGVLLGVVLATLGSCTVVKPLVCTVSYPIDCMCERLDAVDDEDPEDLPPVLVFLAAPVLIPMRFVSEAAIGCVGGLFSGFASDLNVITAHCSSPERNLTKPFRTNARKDAD